MLFSVGEHMGSKSVYPEYLIDEKNVEQLLLQLNYHREQTIRIQQILKQIR